MSDTETYHKITVSVESPDGTVMTLEFPKTKELVMNYKAIPDERLVGVSPRVTFVRNEMNFDFAFKGELDETQGIIYRETTVHPPAKEVGKEQ